MNLPQLDTVRVPLERTSNRVQFRTVHELLTPLNSIYARFSEVKEVPALKTQLQVPDEAGAFFGLASGQPTFLTIPTLKLVLKNGEVWHFAEDGDFAAVEKNGFRTIYLRGQNGKVSRIVGLIGTRLMASIDLVYDADGRIMSATGKNSQGEQTISYEYDPAGKLTGVVSDLGKLGYRYGGEWVTAVTWRDSDTTGADLESSEKIMRRFEYNKNGQLIAEFGEDGKRIAYNVTSGTQGNTIMISQPGDTASSHVFHYDSAFKAVEARFADGTRTTWTYPENGGSILEFRDIDGTRTRITESADRRRRTFEAPNRPPLIEIYDEAGRLTDLNAAGRSVLRQRWYANGTLQAIETESRITQPQYGEDGLLTGIVLFPPGEDDQPNYWQKTELDFAGRPVKITDFSGLHTAIQYDNKGEIAQMITKRDGENYGYTESRDDEGRVLTVQSSWGKEEYDYDSDGELEIVTVEKNSRQGSEQTILEFESGRLRHIKQFDGGEMAISYYDDGPLAGLPEQLSLANGLQLDYNYDSSGNLNGVQMGNSRRVQLEYDAKGRIVGYVYLPNRN